MEILENTLTPNSGKTCAITGASGFVGKTIASHLVKLGWKVLDLGRKPCGLAQTEHYLWHLGDPLPQGVGQSATGLVHCAWAMNLQGSWKTKLTNVEGSIRLLSSARAAGIDKVIFVSSMSAHLEAVSQYALSKLKVEEEARRLGAYIVRPGLVFSEHPQGMISSIRRIVEIAPIVPILSGGKQKLYPCYDKDLANFITTILTPQCPIPAGVPLVAAHPAGQEFATILANCAKMLKKHTTFINIPWRWAWLLLKGLEVIGFRPKMSSDSLLGLVYYDRSPQFIPEVSRYFLTPLKVD